MGHLNVRYFNYFCARSGTLFEGRFRSFTDFTTSSFEFGCESRTLLTTRWVMMQWRDKKPIVV